MKFIDLYLFCDMLTVIYFFLKLHKFAVKRVEVGEIVCTDFNSHSGLACLH